MDSPDKRDLMRLTSNWGEIKIISVRKSLSDTEGKKARVNNQ